MHFSLLLVYLGVAAADALATWLPSSFHLGQHVRAAYRRRAPGSPQYCCSHSRLPPLWPLWPYFGATHSFDRHGSFAPLATAHSPAVAFSLTPFGSALLSAAALASFIGFILAPSQGPSIATPPQGVRDCLPFRYHRHLWCRSTYSLQRRCSASLALDRYLAPFVARRRAVFLSRRFCWCSAGV